MYKHVGAHGSWSHGLCAGKLDCEVMPLTAVTGLHFQGPSSARAVHTLRFVFLMSSLSVYTVSTQLQINTLNCFKPNFNCWEVFKYF